MVKPLIDLRGPGVEWLRAAPGDARRRAARRNAAACRPWIDAVLAMAGASDFESACPSAIVHAGEGELEAVADEIEDTTWLARAEDSRRRFVELTGVDAPPVVLLVGCFGSNAVQAHGTEGSAAVACLEQFTRHPASLGCPPNSLVPWLVHEQAHVVRYGSDLTDSPVRAFAGRVAELPPFLEGLPTAERLADEGLATALSQRAGAADLRELLMLDHVDSAFLAGGWRSALADAARRARARTLDADAFRARLLHDCDAVPREPPPARWGYLVGSMIANAAAASLERSGDAAPWRRLLLASRHETWRLAAEEMDDPTLPADLEALP